MSTVEVIQPLKRDLVCCAYARVSTLKDEQESSLENQETYWQEKLQNLPNRKFIGVFADQGISGYKVIQRKEYFKMIDLALAGFIDEIYTKSIYRFGRNKIETFHIIEKLREKGVAVIFEIEEINTLTCSNDILLKLKAIFAEQELNTMSKNVRFTQREMFKKGIVPPNKTYGYNIDENKNFVINEEEARVVRLIFSLYLKGYGYQSIANQLYKLGIKSPDKKEIWGKNSIQIILENEKYIGDALLQKRYFEAGHKFINDGELEKIYIRNNHEPIIEREVYDMVQEKMSIVRQERANKYHEPCKHYPLTGKIICGCCGSKYRHRINRKIVNFDQNLWICSKQDNLGKRVCPSTMISQELLYEIILDAYNDFVDMPYMLATDDGLSKNILELNLQLDKLREIYIEKLITYSQFKVENERLKDARDKLLNQQKDYKILSAYQKPRTKLKVFTEEIVDKHIENIIITGFKIEIIFKNKQKVTKEFKYEHRKYCKNY